MSQAIAEAIATIEAKHDVRVLYAAESGSRAWGFASPDSDYDVRFIYVQRRDWYLTIGEPRDVIEAMLPGDLDLSGWELRKTLRLFQRGNAALNEWLGSPIVYADRESLADELRALLPRAFVAPAAYHHYLSMARGVIAEHLQGDAVRLKKVFYALRPLLACRWIANAHTPPQTEFASLYAAPWVDSSERAMIQDLLAAKTIAREDESQWVATPVRQWLAVELAAASAASGAIGSAARIDNDTLDRVFRRHLQD